MTVSPTRPTRPLLRYHGGKFRLAPWIVGHFPEHRVYVEPFGGAASVLLAKRRSPVEVYNDLDDVVVNLFRVLRDEELGPRLLRAVALTPYSPQELLASRELTDDPVESARRLLVRSWFSFGGSGCMWASDGPRRTGFRRRLSVGSPATEWATWPDTVRGLAERLRGVVIEHDTALGVIGRYDGPDALIYADPPYPHHTRNSWDRYRYEMSDAEHEALLKCLLTCRGAVIVSGYRSDTYDRLLEGWRRVDTGNRVTSSNQATECLWLSPRVTEARGLFAERREE